MSKKQLNSRLDNLFDDLEAEAGVAYDSITQTISGWSWECDLDGRYISCSAEIRDLLGYHPDEAEGKYIDEFGLNPPFRNLIRQTLNQYNPDTEIDVVYRSKDGLEVATRMCFLAGQQTGAESTNGKTPVVRGFTQLIQNSPAITRSPRRISDEDNKSTRGISPDASSSENRGSSDAQTKPETNQKKKRPRKAKTVQFEPDLANQHKETEQKHQPNAVRAGPQSLQAPIKVQNQSLGLLELIDDNPERTWSEEEQRLVTNVLDQLSLALENAELFQQTQEVLSETERLYQVSADFNAAGTLEDILRSIGIPNETGDQPFAVMFWQYSGEISGNPEWMSLTTLWTQQGKAFGSQVGNRIHLPDYPGNMEMFSNPSEPVLFANVHQDRLEETTRQTVLFNQGEAVVFLPLSLRGHWIGQVTILWEKPTRFTERDHQRYRSLAAQTAVAINNRLLFEETEHRAQQLEWLSLIKDTLSQATNEAGILSAVSMALDQAVPPQRITLLYFDADNYGNIRNTKTAAFWQDGLVLETIPDWNNNQILELLKQVELFNSHLDKPLVFSNIANDPSLPVLLRQDAAEQKYQTLCLVPLYNAGRWQGTIFLTWQAVYDLAEDELFYLKEIMEPVAGTITSRRSYLAELEARHAMERRNLQLQTAAQVSRAASSILDSDSLVKDTVEIVQKRFDLYYVGLFLVDIDGEWTEQPGQWAVLKAGTGSAGETMLHAGHKLEVDGPSMIGRCIATRQAQIWRGDELKPIRYRNPILPDTNSEMALPLISRNEVIGAMTFQSTRSGDFSDADISVLQTMADQVAIAIQNARLFGRTQEALAETERLYRASGELNLAQSYENILQVIAVYSPSLTNHQAIFLHLFDQPWTASQQPKQVILKSSLKQSPEIFPIEHKPDTIGVFAAELLTNRPIVIENVAAPAPQNLQALQETYRENYQLCSILILPLVAGGQGIGFIETIFTELHKFGENDLKQLSALTTQAAVAFQNLRSLELAELRAQEAYKRSQELALVNRVVTKVSAHTDLKSALSEIARELGQALNVQVGIALMNENQSGLVLLAEHLLNPELPSAIGFTIPITNNPSTQKVLETRQPLIISDPLTNPMTVQVQTALAERGVQTLNLFPMVVGMDVIGTIGLDILQKGRTLEEDEFRLAETIILQAAAAIQSVRLFEQTQAALAESEALYQANSEFNTAQTYSAVLDMLRRYTVLGSNVRYISLNLFDTHWKESFAPEWMIPIASWSVTPDTQPNNQQLLLTSWPAADQVMQPNFPTFITDPLNDPRLAATQEFFQLQDRQAESLLFAPLTVAGNWIGHIIAWYQTSLDFSESELRRLTTLVGQASVVIQNIHSAELTRQRAIQLERLAAVQAALSQAGSEREILSALVLPTDPQNPPQTIRLEYIHTGETEQPEYTELVACWEDGSFLELASKTRTQVNAVPLANLWLSNPDEALFLENTNSQELDSDLRLNVYSGYQSFAIIPLRSGGAWQGLVIYAWQKARQFSADDKFILRRLLEPTSEVVARRRAFLQARQRAQEMTLLFTVSQMLSNAPLASEDIAAIITEQFAHVLEVPKCTLSLLEDGDHTSQLNMVGDFGIASITGSSITNPTRSLSSHPLANKAVETLLPVVAQASDSGLAPHIQQYLQKNNLQTLLVIPLAVKGEAIGIIELISHQWPRFYSPDQLNLAMTLANAAAVALENARLYEEQRQTTERLQEVDHLKTQFLANMSHELRTPLNSIIGFSRVILKGIDGPITELQEQDLGAIFNSGQHLLSLINDILDLSKIEAGKMELAIEEVDLGDMINSVMSTAIGLTKEKPIELQRDIQDDLPLVHVDRTRIRQVLINLLSNAAKFTDTGTIRVTARTQFNTAGKSEVWVGVSDTGPGIAPEDQDKLFKAFSQVDASPTRKTGGTGLGLSISRYLVEMHGGHIGIISEVGNGSTFFFTLPLPDSEKSIPTELSGDGPVILAVDDNSQILNLYERYLGNHNYQIYPLTDPDQTVHIAKQVQPYAITLDVMMPGRDGWSILSQLKQDPDTCHIPVVICSILEDQEKGLRLGAIDYLTKPILEEDLIQALNNLSNHSGLQTVLLVGDNPENRRLIETVVQQNGQYQLETAENEREALLILERITPNAIIVDGDLPGLDGHTLFETFQANPNLQNIPVIILSGDGLDETQPGWLAATGQTILQKSQLTEDALLETLRCKLQPKSSQKTNFTEPS